MALNLADRTAVRRVIADRVTAAVVNFALYVLNEAANTPNHANRVAWAKQAIASPDQTGDALSWYVINQPDFISGGSDIADNVLAGAVETAIQTHFISQT